MKRVTGNISVIDDIFISANIAHLDVMRCTIYLGIHLLSKYQLVLQVHTLLMTVLTLFREYQSECTSVVA